MKTSPASSSPYPKFDNSYARLPQQFYAQQQPQPVATPGPIRVNNALAKSLGFDPEWLGSQTGVAFAAGNFLPEGTAPIATAYAGHQFGGWNPQLGDGRAVLLGEVISTDGQRYDIQLKGSGRTPYSRGGDGRSPLGPVLREYIVSEAMAALGIPTTRALAAATTGESVMREVPLPGGVLVRVAQSHIRIGSLQFFAAQQDHGALETLTSHVIKRHYPESADAANPVRSMLDAIISSQAELIAQWQLVGFIHGVMNTDNMLLSGETVDYGPCAFMDGYDHNTVYSAIDREGRYAYANQPKIAHWNLSQLTQALLPLLDPDPEKALVSGQAAIDAFPQQYTAAFEHGMCRKLGLSDKQDGDEQLIQDLLALMQSEQTDLTLTFRHLSDLAVPPQPGQTSSDAEFELPPSFTPWLSQWKTRRSQDQDNAKAQQATMYSVNPAYIPRNHLVEEAIRAAEDHQDLKPFHSLVDVLANPYQMGQAAPRYAQPPRPEQVVKQTFCGT